GCVRLRLDPRPPRPARRLARQRGARRTRGARGARHGTSERATASEPRERSGDLRGPRERACRGVRRGEAPRKLMSLQIDVFNHILPKPFFDRLQKAIVNRGAIKRWLNIPFLHDLDVRFRMLEEFGPDYRQMLSLSAPPIEAVNPDRQTTIDLA